MILNDDAVAGPVLALLSSAPNFGDQPLATTSAPVTITLGNVGGSPLVLGPGFPGTAGSEFAFVPGPNQCVANESVAPAGNCNLYVTFTPVASGPRSASVLLISNAPSVTHSLNAVGMVSHRPFLDRRHCNRYRRCRRCHVIVPDCAVGRRGPVAPSARIGVEQYWGIVEPRIERANRWPLSSRQGRINPCGRVDASRSTWSRAQPIV